MSRLICSASLLLGLLLITATAEAYTVFCDTLTIEHRDYVEQRDLERLERKLRNYVDNCEYVMGDLMISDLGVMGISKDPIDEKIRNLKTFFLRTIKEIRGRLILQRVNVESILLSSLRVIRGQYYDSDRVRDYDYSIEMHDVVHPTELYLGWLTTIARGGVYISGGIHANLYCYLTRMIDWSELFRKDPWDNSTERRKSSTRVLNVRAVDYVTTDEPGVKVPISAVERLEAICSRLAKCPPMCPINNASKMNCWSGEQGGCQNLQYCGSRTCQTCEFDYNRLTRSCCDSECLGGCIGDPKNCLACRNFRTPSGQCKKACTFEETGIYGLKPYSNFCVKNCSSVDAFTSYDGKQCVDNCPVGQISVNSVCYPCHTDFYQCSKNIISVHTLTDGFRMSKFTLPVWETKSYLLVNGSFSGRRYSFLDALEWLEVFGGDLSITDFDRSLGNLGKHLRRLRIVTGYFVISKVNTTYLGLAKLNLTKFLWVKDISGLCEAWFPSDYIATRRNKPGQFPFTFENLNFDTDSGTCRNATCHRQCRGQCWGPDADMCVADN